MSQRINKTIVAGLGSLAISSAMADDTTGNRYCPDFGFHFSFRDI